MNIQGGSHSSVEDARAALELYKLYEKEIEWDFKDKNNPNKIRHRVIKKNKWILKNTFLFLNKFINK